MDGAIWPEGIWPGLRPIAPMTGGARAVVWRAEDARGRSWVVKSSTRSEAALDWLGLVQEAARAAGLIVPGLVRDAAGRQAPGGWTCEPFVAGRAATAIDLAALRPRLAAFHHASAALSSRPGLPGVAEGAPLPADMAAQAAAALRAALAPMAEAGVAAIHGDLNPGNVIVTPDGPALIDWDEARRDWRFLDEIAARPATPAEARAALAVEILACWAPEPARARELTQRLVAAG